MTIIWTDEALNSLLDIGSYIAQDNPKRAKSFTTELYERSDQLKTHPRSGRPVPEDPFELSLEIIHKNYRIIYEIKNDDLILIHFAIHGSKRLGEEFFKFLKK